MGANVARDFAIAHPELTRSLIMVGAGAGSVNREEFLKSQAAAAAALDREGIGSRVRSMETLATRTSFKARVPARLRRVPPPVGRARRAGVRAPRPRGDVQAPDGAGARGRAARAGGADADHGGRPGRAVRRALAADARADPPRRPRGVPRVRPHAQHRGARAVQRPRRGVPLRGRGRALGGVVRVGSGTSAPLRARPGTASAGGCGGAHRRRFAAAPARLAVWRQGPPSRQRARIR